MDGSIINTVFYRNLVELDEMIPAARRLVNMNSPLVVGAEQVSADMLVNLAAVERRAGYAGKGLLMWGGTADTTLTVLGVSLIDDATKITQARTAFTVTDAVSAHFGLARGNMPMADDVLKGLHATVRSALSYIGKAVA